MLRRRPQAVSSPDSSRGSPGYRPKGSIFGAVVAGLRKAREKRDTGVPSTEYFALSRVVGGLSFGLRLSVVARAEGSRAPLRDSPLRNVTALRQPARVVRL